MVGGKIYEYDILFGQKCPLCVFNFSQFNALITKLQINIHNAGHCKNQSKKSQILIVFCGTIKIIFQIGEGRFEIMIFAMQRLNDTIQVVFWWLLN